MSDCYKGMPDSVRIGCFQFKVVVGDVHEHDGTFGWMAPGHKRISLSRGLDADRLANVFMHEVIHAIHYLYGLLPFDENSPPRSEEEFTTLTANGLCAFWQDNPEAMKWWLKTLNTK